MCSKELMLIKEMAKDLEKAGLNSAYTTCPFCNDPSNSFSVTITEPGTVLYNCFRAKCGRKGRLGGHYKYSEIDRSFRRRRDRRDLVPLEDLSFLPVKELSVQPRWDARLSLVMYPVLSPWGHRLGYVQRHYKEVNSWWEGPKAMNIVEDDSVAWAHFPSGQNYSNGVLVVVEDIPSAEAVSKIIPAVALTGVHISDRLCSLLLEIGIRKLLICLDNDALLKAAQLKRKLGLIFESIEVVFVDEDPKDMAPQKLEEVFKNANDL